MFEHPLCNASLTEGMGAGEVDGFLRAFFHKLLTYGTISLFHVKFVYVDRGEDLRNLRLVL